MFRRSGVPPGRYSIRVIAYDRITGERAILRSSVTIAKMAPDSPEENTFCGVTIVNRGTAARSSNAVIYFTGTGASRNFMCRKTTKEREPLVRTSGIVCDLAISPCVLASETSFPSY